MKTVYEIKGIAFPNKGAEMLLVACLEQLEARGYYGALEPYSPFEHKLAYPLFVKTRIHRFGVNILAPFNWLPAYARDRLGFVRPRDVRLALDASGFAYGAPWPVSLAHQRLLGEKLRCPVVMLPQSWGEFTAPAQQKVAKGIMSRAKLVFAREPEGADNLEQATGHRPKVVPDITFGVHVTPDETPRDVVIVPNFQVEKRQGAAYVDTLVAAARDLAKAGRQITLLNHEGPKDKDICMRIQTQLADLGITAELSDPATGPQAKAIIGAARFVITSRYHGLIAALSQGVACYPLGWSYKYTAAMRLFYIEIEDSVGHPDHIVDRVQSATYCDQFTSTAYQTRRAEVRAQVEAMWDEIFALTAS